MAIFHFRIGAPAPGVTTRRLVYQLSGEQAKAIQVPPAGQTATITIPDGSQIMGVKVEDSKEVNGKLIVGEREVASLRGFVVDGSASPVQAPSVVLAAVEREPAKPVVPAPAPPEPAPAATEPEATPQDVAETTPDA